MMINPTDFIAAFLGGMFSVASPCVLPMVPSIISVVSGDSDESFLRRMRGPVLFVAGFSIAFIAIGAGVGLLAKLLIPYLGEISFVFGWLLILIGLVLMVSVERLAKRFRMFAFLARTFSSFDDLATSKPKMAERFGVLWPVIIGLGFGFAWTPCIGPILTGIVIIAANSGSMLVSTSLLATYSFGMALPFLAAAAISVTLFKRFLRHVRKIEIISGVILFTYGLLVVTGLLVDMTRFLTENIPDITEWYRG